MHDNTHKQPFETEQAPYQDAQTDIATSLHNIGIAYKALGDTNKGLDYYEQALRMRQAIYKDDSSEVAGATQNNAEEEL
jgi:tetratricopeptide (TPR) repeat protein